MSATLLCDVALFVLVVFGLGQPGAAAWNRWEPLERLVLAIAAALVAVYLAAFAFYLSGAGAAWHWLLPAAAALGLALNWRATRAFLHAPGVVAALGAWLLVAAWSLALLALVYSYSGGGWMGDWQEHYERARFFLHRWPRDFQFIGVYSLTARPPLANLITSSFLAQTDDRFAQFQVFTTLLNTLVFFPALLFVRRWSPAGRAFPAVLALVLMLNPLFAQNTTFAWTKLIAGFFILAALYFLAPPPTGTVAARRPAGPALALFAAGVLTHYSAGPWIAAFLPLGLWAMFRQPGGVSWRALLADALAAGMLLATWFGWAGAQFGAAGTVGTNSSVRSLGAATLAENFHDWMIKLGCTLVPHPFHWTNPEMTAQTNRLTWLRDYFFNLYQLNLPFAFGLAGLLVLLLAAGRARGRVVTAGRGFWLAGIPLVVAISMAVQAGGADFFGVTHVCLQPLVILGLAFVAATLARGGVPWLALGLLWAADFAFGIALHFAGEAYFLGWQRGMDLNQYVLSLNAVARFNLAGKFNLHLSFLRDLVPLTPGQVALVALALLALGLALAARALARAGKPAAAP